MSSLLTRNISHLLILLSAKKTLIHIENNNKIKELLMQDLQTDENYTTNYKILHRIVNNEYLNEYPESPYLQDFEKSNLV